MKIGSKVRDRGDFNEVGTIIGKYTDLVKMAHPDEDMWIVEWDNDTIDKKYETELIEINSQMDKDFELIRRKVADARKTLHEAQKLAEKHYVSLGEVSREVRELQLDLNEGGWINSGNCY